MKKSEEDRLKCAIIREHPSAAARSPFPNGEGCETGKAVSSTQSIPRVGKVASKASRIGFWWYEKEGRSYQVDDSQKHPLQKQLIKPIYSYKKRKSNAANDFNVMYPFRYR